MSSENGYKYWAFISYSSKDKKWGQWLHKRLENYPIPEEFQGTELFDGAVLGKNLRPVFRDRDELSGSSDLGPAILRALEQTRYLVVLCSKNSAKSQWVNKEIEDFQAMGRGKHILALILDGEPNATNQDGIPDSEECFPPSLRYPSEPLAGDLRKNGDGKERGFLKVLAGISQLDFDVLYRRHERAQRRKHLTLGVIASTIIFLLTSLSFYAIQQRDEAKRNANEAESQRLIAVTNEKEAEKNAQEAEAQRARVASSEKEARSTLSRQYFKQATKYIKSGNQNAAATLLIESFANDSEFAPALDQLSWFLGRRTIKLLTLSESLRPPPSEDVATPDSETFPDSFYAHDRLYYAFPDSSAYLLQSGNGARLHREGSQPEETDRQDLLLKLYNRNGFQLRPEPEEGRKYAWRVPADGKHGDGIPYPLYGLPALSPDGKFLAVAGCSSPGNTPESPSEGATSYESPYHWVEEWNELTITLLSWPERKLVTQVDLEAPMGAENMDVQAIGWNSASDELMVTWNLHDDGSSRVEIYSVTDKLPAGDDQSHVTLISTGNFVGITVPQQIYDGSPVCLKNGKLLEITPFNLLGDDLNTFGKTATNPEIILSKEYRAIEQSAWPYGYCDSRPERFLRVPSPSADYSASYTASGAIEVFSGKKNELQFLLKTPFTPGEGGSVPGSLSWTSDGRYLAAGTFSVGGGIDYLFFYEPSTGEEVFDMRSHFESPTDRWTVYYPCKVKSVYASIAEDGFRLWNRGISMEQFDPKGFEELSSLNKELNPWKISDQGVLIFEIPNRINKDKQKALEKSVKAFWQELYPPLEAGYLKPSDEIKKTGEVDD